MLLKNDWAIEEIKGEIKRYIETNENENTTYQNFWDTEEAVIRGKFIITGLSQEIRKIPYNLKLYLKKLEEEQMKVKVSRRKEIIKIRAELNEIENKKTIENINE